MQLVLQTDEGLVSGLGELDVTEDGTGNIRADLLCILCYRNGLKLVLWDVKERVVWCRMLAAEDIQV